MTQLRPRPAPAANRRAGDPVRNPVLRLAVAAAFALLGFLLVAQVRATETLGQRLETEREEDLARILAGLAAEGDRLQTDITDLRLTLLAFSNSAERDELARASLRERLDDLRILAGTVPATGEGVQLLVADPAGQVTQDLLVDTVQELRDAGAEAIAVGGLRLVASSAFTTRGGELLVDGRPLTSPYVVRAIGPSRTLAGALAIPGGAVDALQSRPSVTATVSALPRLRVPAREDPRPFVIGQPVDSPPAG